MARLDSDMEAALSTISQTYVGLKWLYWLRPTDSAPVDRAVEFLRRSQQPDGYWDEPDEILEHSPPPWMAPGDFANQVWLTVAMCSRLVLHSRQGDVRFDEAVEFLRAAWDGSRFPRYNHTHWVSLVVFGLMDDPTAIDREIFEGCAGFLERTLAEGRTDAVDLIETARDALYAGQWGTRLSEAALPKLLASQAGDGGWTTGYGDRHRPVSTVEAIYVLKLAASRRPSETA